MAQDEFDPPLDAGVAGAVKILRAAGVETFESCEGGAGHAYPETTVRFEGDPADGLAALSVAMGHGLPVSELRRVWYMQDGEPTGPVWELTFFDHVPATADTERISDDPALCRSVGSRTRCCSRCGTAGRRGRRRS